MHTLIKLRVMVPFALLTGCVSYHAKPLDDAQLNQRLAVPNHEILVEKAATLQHPRLPPITLDLSKPFTENALAVIAVLVNPALKALRAQEHVAEAQVFAAGLLPDPQISGALDFPTGGATGLVTAYTLGLSWNIASLITRPVEKRIATSHARQVHYDVAWQEWLIANQVRLLTRRHIYLGRQAELARQAEQIAGRLLDMTRRNVTAGDAKLDELGLRQVAYLDAQDRALALARDLEKARHELNQMLGLPPREQVPLARIELRSLPENNADDLFAQARHQRLDLIALQAGYASQETSLYRAVLGQYPGFSVGFTAMRDTSNIRTRGGNVTVDIPIINGNRGIIAVAEATREQLYQEYAARLHQTRADITTVLADLQRIEAERAPLARQVPELARAEEVLRAAVENRDVTLISYETVRASLLDKQLKLLGLEQAAAEQQVALQLAVGSLLNL